MPRVVTLWRRLSAAFVAVSIACAASASDFDDAVVALRAGRLAEARGAFETLARAGDMRAQDTYATLLARGLGGSRDLRAAMGWYCRLAHHEEGGKAILRAVWYLGEYFRTGGGLPGRYADGRREDEDPIRAYFWYGVLARSRALYQHGAAGVARVGNLGMSTVGRELYAREKRTLDAAIARWRPTRSPGSGPTCLALPEGLRH